MGNSLLCEKCEPESVINLSDNCMERITNEEKEKKKDKTKECDPKGEDDLWMKKLKCLDDIHTNNYGLSVQVAEELFQSLEQYFTKLPPPPCETRTMIFCLQNNEHCMIHCKKLLDEFIDCIDTIRITKVQETMACEKKAKQEEEEKEEMARQQERKNCEKEE